jgi:CRISPR-associated endonuclease/helicase Cas3
MLFAHSQLGQPEEKWEPLEKHLHDVACLSGKFAEAFGAREWGALAGRWHDLGKFQQAFQDYLRYQNQGDAHQLEMTGKVDHSTPGAQHAVARLKRGGRLLAYIIAGHHSGLLDAVNSQDASGASLEKRLRKEIAGFFVPSEIANQPSPAPPNFNWDTDQTTRAFQVAFFCRMLFSCLVDADFLATEAFLNPQQSSSRPISSLDPGSIRNQLYRYVSELAAKKTDSQVKRARGDVLAACTQMATKATGFFSLTVPTGGGKTLSSLAFALDHARLHNLRSIIFAIPFTSIIEQNADVFRTALGPFGNLVLEHHGNNDFHRATVSQRLASENWDAPIIVTTNVQFFESLFASRTSRCRKLHRIARSVIILDEVQTLPTELIRPTLAALRELVHNYGCTVVLCTATQPAIKLRDNFKIGLQNVREIVGTTDQVNHLFDTLRRTHFEYASKLNDDVLAQQLSAQRQVLCIVNSRAHAAALFEELRASNPTACFHLSTRMCARHRAAVLRLIRRRLRTGQPCRVISTSLIEAGVDIDLPVVYRAMAGLDSIAQAAGRCNREGRSHVGRVVIFETDWKTLPSIRQAADFTREVMPDHADLLSPPAVDHFFRVRLWKRKDEWDKYGICDLFSISKSGEQFQFRTVAEKYKLIDNDQVSVIVPFARTGKRLATELMQMTSPPDRAFERRLQRFIVGIPPFEADQMLVDGVIQIYHDKFHVLMDSQIAGAFKAYDPRLGLLSRTKINMDVDVWVS